MMVGVASQVEMRAHHIQIWPHLVGAHLWRDLKGYIKIMFMVMLIQQGRRKHLLFGGGGGGHNRSECHCGLESV